MPSKELTTLLFMANDTPVLDASAAFGKSILMYRSGLSTQMERCISILYIWKCDMKNCERAEVGTLCIKWQEEWQLPPTLGTLKPHIDIGILHDFGVQPIH